MLKHLDCSSFHVRFERAHRRTKSMECRGLPMVLCELMGTRWPYVVIWPICNYLSSGRSMLVKIIKYISWTLVTFFSAFISQDLDRSMCSWPPMFLMFSRPHFRFLMSCSLFQGGDGPSGWSASRAQETAQRLSKPRVVEACVPRAQDALLLQTRKREYEISSLARPLRSNNTSAQLCTFHLTVGRNLLSSHSKAILTSCLVSQVIALQWGAVPKVIILFVLYIIRTLKLPLNDVST